jgi:hypothetical protein
MLLSFYDCVMRNARARTIRLMSRSCSSYHHRPPKVEIALSEILSNATGDRLWREAKGNTSTMAFAGWTSAYNLVGTANRTPRQLRKRGRIGICSTAWTSHDVHSPLRRLEGILPTSGGTHSRYNGYNSEPSKSLGASLFRGQFLTAPTLAGYIDA